MEKAKWYMIGFYIVFGFECAMEFGFFVRFGLGFREPSNFFTYAMIVPIVFLGNTLAFGSVFLRRFLQELKLRKGQEFAYRDAILAVKSRTKRYAWNVDMLYQFGGAVFMAIIFVGIPVLVFMVNGYTSMKKELAMTSCKNDQQKQQRNNVITINQ